MIEKEDKLSLARKRIELVERLASPMAPEALIRTQGELSSVNDKIKALNKIEAARQKAEADRRKLAGMAEAQANAARAMAKINGSALPEDDQPEDDDPGQTAAIDGWIDAVLLRHDVDFIRHPDGTLTIAGLNVPENLAATIELLVTGIYAAARGQELPDLPSAAPKALKATKAPKAPKVKKRS